MTAPMTAPALVKLGCMNGWAEYPAAYLEHQKALARGEKHEVHEARPWTGYHVYTCRECCIQWAVDSSD
jgi:hypothetical protein